MTEDQIERSVERQMDRLDRQFLAGRIEQWAYDASVKLLNTWADEQYRFVRKA